MARKRIMEFAEETADMRKMHVCECDELKALRSRLAELRKAVKREIVARDDYYYWKYTETAHQHEIDRAYCELKSARTAVDVLIKGEK